MLASTKQEIRDNLIYILDEIVHSRQYLNKHFQNSINNYFLENYATLPSLKNRFDTMSGRQVRKEIFDKYSMKNEDSSILKCFLLMKGFVLEHILNESLDEYRNNLILISQKGNDNHNDSLNQNNITLLKGSQDWISLQWKRLFALMILHHTYFPDIEGSYELWYHTFGDRLIARHRQKNKKDEIEFIGEFAPYIVDYQIKQTEENSCKNITSDNNQLEPNNKDVKKVKKQKSKIEEKSSTKQKTKIIPKIKSKIGQYNLDQQQKQQPLIENVVEPKLIKKIVTNFEIRERMDSRKSIESNRETFYNSESIDNSQDIYSSQSLNNYRSYIDQDYLEIENINYSQATENLESFQYPPFSLLTSNQEKQQSVFQQQTQYQQQDQSLSHEIFCIPKQKINYHEQFSSFSALSCESSKRFMNDNYQENLYPFKSYEQNQFTTMLPLSEETYDNQYYNFFSSNNNCEINTTSNVDQNQYCNNQYYNNSAITNNNNNICIYQTMQQQNEFNYE